MRGLVAQALVSRSPLPQLLVSIRAFPVAPSVQEALRVLGGLPSAREGDAC